MTTTGPPAPPRIAARDAAVAGGYALMVVALAVVAIPAAGLAVPRPLWTPPVSLVLLLGAVLGTLWRRRAPQITLAVTGVLSCIELAGAGQVAAYILLFDAIWAPIVHGRDRTARAATALALGAAAGVLLAATAWTGEGLDPVQAITIAIAIIATVIATPLMWGWEVRHHRQAQAGAEALVRAEQALAIERAGRAVDTERRRIAQDLHDMVAGHLGAVVLHSSLATTLPDPAAREASLGTASDAATAALRDLRATIAVLTGDDDGGAGDPAPVAETTLSWSDLGARLRTADDPEPAVSIDPRVEDPAIVDPALRAALLRIASEAVTNALRHGGPPRTLTVGVEEADGADVAVLTCRNTLGPGATTGRGHGRDAIADRARAVGGQAGSGPSGPRAWCVRARLPLAPAVPRPEEIP